MSQSVTATPPPTSNPPRFDHDAAPAGVRERAAEADRRIREMQDAARAAAEANPPAPPPPQSAPGQRPPEGQTPPPPQESRPEPKEDPKPRAEPEPKEDRDELQAQLDRLTQEVRTWRGRYESELPRERRAREQAEQQINVLESRMAEAGKPVEDANAPSKDELDAYGEDLFKLVERYMMPKISQHITAAISRIEARFGMLETTVGQTTQQVQKTQWEQFIDRLDDSIPMWREHDNTQAFNNWLDEIDPFFGVPRREALDTATRNMDDGRVVKVFEAYLNQQTAKGSRPAKGKRTEPQGTGAPPTAPAQPDASPSLEDYAAPGKPGPTQAAPLPAQPGANIWTIAEVQAFYRDRAKGVFRSRPEEADRIEREIAAAQREGRLQP